MAFSAESQFSITFGQQELLCGNFGGMPIDLTKPSPRLKTSVSLPQDILPAAREVAKAHGVSLSDYIARLLREDLTSREIERKG
jgi:hypothetical protein